MVNAFKKRISEPSELFEDDTLTKKLVIRDARMFSRKGSSYRKVSKDILRTYKMKNGKILDLACGYGGLIGVMAKQLPKSELVGVDASNWIINLAKQLHTKQIKFKTARQKNSHSKTNPLT